MMAPHHHHGSSATTSQPRIPEALQAVFLASNRGEEVHKPPPGGVAFRVFRRVFGRFRGNGQNNENNNTAAEVPQSNKNKLSKDIPQQQLPPKNKNKKGRFWIGGRKSADSQDKLSSRALAKTSKKDDIDILLSRKTSPQVYLNNLMRSRGYSATFKPAGSFLRSAFYHGNNNNGTNNANNGSNSNGEMIRYYEVLVELIRRDDKKGFRTLLETGIPPNPSNRRGESVAHYVCCQKDKYEYLRMMLNYSNSSLLRSVDSNGSTPLHYACMASIPSFPTIEVILDADVSLATLRDHLGREPLSLINRGNWKVWLEWLVAEKDTFWPIRKKNRGSKKKVPPIIRIPSSSISTTHTPKDAAVLMATGQLTPDELMNELDELELDDYDDDDDDGWGSFILDGNDELDDDESEEFDHSSSCIDYSRSTVVDTICGGSRRSISERGGSERGGTGHDNPGRSDISATTRTTHTTAKKKTTTKKESQGISPQEYLEETLRSRGYSTVKRPALLFGYDSPPTSLQLASHSPYIVGLARRNNIEEFRKILDSGISPNPHNGIESLAHLICRMGGDQRISFIHAMVEKGTDEILRVVNDQGRTLLHEACTSSSSCSGSSWQQQGQQSSQQQQQQPSFETVQLIMDTDIKLIMMTDSENRTPLCHVKEKDWSSWISWLDSVKDTYWPNRLSSKGREVSQTVAAATASPPLSPHDAFARRNGNKLPDPFNALSAELATMVSSGRVKPEELCVLIDNDDDDDDDDEEDNTGESFATACSSDGDLDSVNEAVVDKNNVDDGNDEHDEIGNDGAEVNSPPGSPKTSAIATAIHPHDRSEANRVIAVADMTTTVGGACNKNREIPSEVGGGATKSNSTTLSSKAGSPQEYLDNVLESRGYSTIRHETLRTAYYSKPTPLQLASLDMHLMAILQMRPPSAFREIMSCGISPNPCSIHGESLLHVVCRNGDNDRFRIMVENGAEIRVSDRRGRTPLHEACLSTSPSFDMIDKMLATDRYLAYMADKKGALPLSLIPKSVWPTWIEWLQSNIDMHWPTERNDDEPSALIGWTPNSRPIPDPENALTVELAEMVASGRAAPADAIKEMRGGGGTANRRSSTSKIY